VTTPPVLTQAEYIAFLDSLPVHPSRLHFASERGNVEEVKRIFLENPNLDVNWRTEREYNNTALLAAGVLGHSAIVAILLAHPTIDVNMSNRDRETPFKLARRSGPTCVREMLMDARVKINEPDIRGRTPLWYAAINGRLDTIRLWIASGREIDLGTPGNNETDAIGAAEQDQAWDKEPRRKNKVDVAALLKRFKSDASKTRAEVKIELGITGRSHFLHSSFRLFLNSHSISDFPVTTPPVLTQAEYIAFLGSLPVHPSSVFFASFGGNVEEVKEIPRNNPNLDVNWKLAENGNGNTALIRACDEGHDTIVSILLAHPTIDVNLSNRDGETPFLQACCYGSTSCVLLLLKDQRVEVNQPDSKGYTPLSSVAHDGHLDLIEWWIASGREMNLGTPGDGKTDVIRAAERRGETEVVTLLERFRENPEETRQVRLEIGWYDEAAAEIFALVVFVSDGLLQIKDTTQSPAARFLSIARRLPLELQMIICHRVVGSTTEIIRAQDSEVAFKSLAESLLWTSFFANS